MQIHVINVSIADTGEQEAERNRFLSSHKVVASQRMEAGPKVRTAFFAAATGTTTPGTAAPPLSRIYLTVRSRVLRGGNWSNNARNCRSAVEPNL
jgi:hypothetical protein